MVPMDQIPPRDHTPLTLDPSSPRLSTPDLPTLPRRPSPRTFILGSNARSVMYTAPSSASPPIIPYSKAHQVGLYLLQNFPTAYLIIGGVKCLGYGMVGRWGEFMVAPEDTLYEEAEKSLVAEETLYISHERGTESGRGHQMAKAIVQTFPELSTIPIHFHSKPPRPSNSPPPQLPAAFSASDPTPTTPKERHQSNATPPSPSPSPTKKVRTALDHFALATQPPPLASSAASSPSSSSSLFLGTTSAPRTTTVSTSTELANYPSAAPPTQSTANDTADSLDGTEPDYQLYHTATSSTIVAGCSIGQSSGGGGTGSLGLFVEMKGRIFGLSNSHVLPTVGTMVSSPSNGDKTRYLEWSLPYSRDPQEEALRAEARAKYLASRPPIGTVSRSHLDFVLTESSLPTPHSQIFQRLDFALINLDPTVPYEFKNCFEMKRTGDVIKFGNAIRGETVGKRGRTTGLTYGAVCPAFRMGIHWHDDPDPLRLCTELTIVKGTGRKPFSDCGDSGAAVWEKEDGKVIGLCNGGPDESFTFFTSISTIFEHLEEGLECDCGLNREGCTCCKVSIHNQVDEPLK